MKVLFIITQAELGGAQRWVFDTAVNLDKSIYEIIVAAGESGPLFSKLQSQNIKTYRIKYLIRNISPLKDILGLIEVYHLIKKEKPDILQLCSTKAGFIGSIAGRLAGTRKIIYRIGGWSFNDPRPWWQNKIFLWLEKLTAPLKNKIIVNSQKGYNEAINLKICPKEKLFLLYNGIQIKGQAPRTNDQKNIIIGTIANFYPTKGLIYLIEAANILKLKIPNSRFTIHIVGNGKQRHLLESLINKYGLENHIKLVGQKEHPWQYLNEKNINIFVIPSVKEGMPYVLLEAMAEKIPVIATKVGGIPEIIKNGENGLLVEKENPQELADAIETLIGNQEFRKKLAEQAFQDIQKFQLSEMVSKYLRIIELEIKS